MAKVRRKKVTYETKTAIIDAFLANESWRDVAEEKGVNKNTAKSIVRRYIITGKLNSKSRRGGSISKERGSIRQFLLAQIDGMSGAKLSLTKLASLCQEQLGVEVSRCTVHRMLKNEYFVADKPNDLLISWCGDVLARRIEFMKEVAELCCFGGGYPMWLATQTLSVGYLRKTPIQEVNSTARNCTIYTSVSPHGFVSSNVSTKPFNGSDFANFFEALLLDLEDSKYSNRRVVVLMEEQMHKLTQSLIESKRKDSPEEILPHMAVLSNPPFSSFFNIASHILSILVERLRARNSSPTRGNIAFRRDPNNIVSEVEYELSSIPKCEFKNIFFFFTQLYGDYC